MDLGISNFGLKSNMQMDAAVLCGDNVGEVCYFFLHIYFQDGLVQLTVGTTVFVDPLSGKFFIRRVSGLYSSYLLFLIIIELPYLPTNIDDLLSTIQEEEDVFLDRLNSRKFALSQKCVPSFPNVPLLPEVQQGANLNFPRQIVSLSGKAPRQLTSSVNCPAQSTPNSISSSNTHIEALYSGGMSACLPSNSSVKITVPQNGGFKFVNSHENFHFMQSNQTAQQPTLHQHPQYAHRSFDNSHYHHSGTFSQQPHHLQLDNETNQNVHKMNFNHFANNLNAIGGMADQYTHTWN